ncbi:hypothetical protein [Sporolactobacillus shoreicorticis]|uniref:hypothetical protein n=1 Tax=Sporolactobacillus shoreicorticis TaxID=1923877 RepID=UPI00403A5905
MEDKRKDYLKYLGRLAQREASFSDIGDYITNQFSTIDSHPADFHTFTLNGPSLAVENNLLGEAAESFKQET